MKIIEALKKIKDLRRKADDIKDKVRQYCCDLDCETPVYPDQRRQVSEWMQAHSDILKEILNLKFRIAKTNLTTTVSIELGGKTVTKSIMEWIERRKDLAKLEEDLQRQLGNHKNYKEQYSSQPTPNTPPVLIKIRYYFDPVERDKKIDMYRSEPIMIDSTLEIINAVTDLLEN